MHKVCLVKLNEEVVQLNMQGILIHRFWVQILLVPFTFLSLLSLFILLSDLIDWHIVVKIMFSLKLSNSLKPYAPHLQIFSVENINLKQKVKIIVNQGKSDITGKRNI